MKKVALLLALVLVLMPPVSVQAVTPRSINTVPTITYSGTQANCVVQIIDSNPSSDIEATIKLWRRNTCLEKWEVSGSGIIIFSDTVTVEKGNTYRLSVDVTVNGVTNPTVTYSKKCE